MGYPSNSQTCQKYESSRPSLGKPHISQCGWFCVCVCVLSLKGRWDFFPTGHQIKSSYSSYSLFTAFFISLSTTFYFFFSFICAFGIVIITFSFSFSSVLSVIMFRCPLFVNLSFSSARYIYFFHCLHLYLFYYIFIYLFIYLCVCLEVLGNNGNVHPNIQPFTNFSA